jgi:AraC-like DNA-binding protein
MSLFWAVTLMSDSKGHHLSRRYLSVFMLVPALLMFCQFLYFAPFPEWFVVFDLPLQFIGMMVFPLYHVYFRLLTVDKKLSIKKHFSVHMLPVIISIAYAVAVFNASGSEYRAWLFHKYTDPDSLSVQFLQLTRNALKIGVCIQVVYYSVANHVIINKYADRAAQFYSDERDAKTRYAKLLNLSVILTGLVTFVLFAIGRAFLMSAENIIIPGWIMLTVSFYMIGSLGARQKVINPDVEEANNDEPAQLLIQSENEQDVLMNKILSEFRENKLYLNSELTIHDVAKIVGSNRTYLSTIINQKFNQNFCAFVNGFRVKELERVMLENPDYVLDQYVMLCGFGSVNSMKRSVGACAGMSFNDLRSKVLMKKRA